MDGQPQKGTQNETKNAKDFICLKHNNILKTTCREHNMDIVALRIHIHTSNPHSHQKK